MIYIDKEQLRVLVPTAYFENLERSLTAVERLATDEEKSAYIERNAGAYRAFRTWLWVRGSHKCWYSETLLEEGEGEVEHFRPKLKVWDTQPAHSGYKWLAFDWRNLRLAHPIVNKRRTDHGTGRKAGKGCYFPIRPGSPRATRPGEERREHPVLLDPTDPNDCGLICFDGNSGSPTPRYGPDHPWEHTRATVSIELYHLSNTRWNADRADHMRAVGILCDRLLDAKARNHPDYHVLRGELLRYGADSAEFSAAARQVFCEKQVWPELYPSPVAAAVLAAAPEGAGNPRVGHEGRD